MVLSTTTKTSRISSITNQDTKGGSKKAGFPYQIGRSWRTSLALGGNPNTLSKCCNLTQTNLIFNKKVNIPRNIGRYVGPKRR
jgi:hypothetical protein